MGYLGNFDSVNSSLTWVIENVRYHAQPGIGIYSLVFEIISEEKTVQDNGAKQCQPEPDVFPRNSFGVISLANPTPILS